MTGTHATPQPPPPQPQPPQPPPAGGAARRHRRAVLSALAGALVLLLAVAAAVELADSDRAGHNPTADGPGGPNAITGLGTPPPSTSAMSSSAVPSAAASPAVGGAGTAASSTTTAAGPPARGLAGVRNWVMKIQGYDQSTIASLAKAPQPLVVIDLAHDAHTDWFTPAELATLHAAGKTVLSYFEIGAIEDNRPEYPGIRAQAPDLILNQWPAWPHEYFVKYWDERWWDRAVQPRIDRAVQAGFDGVYLDTPLAYAELDLAMAPGETRDTLGRRMVDLIMRVSSTVKRHKAGMLVFPQNSPELRRYAGYLRAIDGIGMESMFFAPTDKPCDMDWCSTNLAEASAVHAAGKTVLAIDYAVIAANVATACARDAAHGFTGYVTTLQVNRIGPPCG